MVRGLDLYHMSHYLLQINWIVVHPLTGSDTVADGKMPWDDKEDGERERVL